MAGIKVEVDWDRTGYTTVPDDVTTFVRPGQQPISVSYGRDQSTALAPTVSGNGSVTLSNADRRFSPRAATLANGTANPLYGLTKPARPVRITRTITGLLDTYADLYGDEYSAGSATYVLFVGHTDDNPINPDVDSKTVSLALLDSLADFRGLTISTPLYSGIRTGEAIGYILDACGWSSSLRDLDAGATVIPWFWVDGKDAFTALEELIRSEGPPALLTMGSAGEIVFRDRHHRLIRANSTTSQATWRGTGSLEPVMQRGFSYDEAWRNIVNTGTASVDVRTPQELQVIWTSDTTVSLSANEETLVTASVTDPFYNAIPPVAGIDYTAVSGTVTTTLFRSSGASATIKLTAGGSPAVISNLQLRAQPVTVAYTVQVSASDVGSTADYGARSFPGDLPWCGPADAQAVLSQAVAQRARPLPIISTRFLIGNNLNKAAQILSRDLSDRITVIEPETVTNSDFYLESIGHELTGDFDHAVTFGLEAVPPMIDPVFKFGTDPAHGFGVGKFGNGIPDPANLFIFGSTTAGHRMGEGVFVP